MSWLASTTMAAAPSADPSSMMTRLHLESPQLTPQEAFKSQGPAQLLARLFSTGQAVQAGPVPASLASLSTGPQGEQTHLDALLDQVGMDSSHSSERALGSVHVRCAQEWAAEGLEQPSKCVFSLEHEDCKQYCFLKVCAIAMPGDPR